VRPGDAVFQGQAGLPTWAVTLIRELGRGGKEASPHLLTPLTALDEVMATARSVADGRNQIREADRISLGKDVSASLKSLGPAVQKVSGAVLRAFQSDDLRRLPELLADVDGARRARSSAKALIAELLLPRTSRAVWDDVVQAFETPTPFETCTVRIAQLRENSVRRGQSWDAVERQLVGVLSDSLHYVAETGAVDVEVTNENFLDLAGLSLERRIELCRAVVSDAPVEEHSIVWMVFGHAALRTAFLRTGPVQFFNGDLPLTAIRDGCPALDTPAFERPAELEHPMADTFFDELPERPFVFARVDVDSRHVADVRRLLGIWSPVSWRSPTEIQRGCCLRARPSSPQASGGGRWASALPDRVSIETIRGTTARAGSSKSSSLALSSGWWPLMSGLRLH
jgi:hypothetical protein